MQKYNDFLVEQVRSGKAQIQVDGNGEWGELLCVIFPKRTELIVTYNYYHSHVGAIDGYKMVLTPNDSLPIIHAKDFLIQEPGVNWVEVSTAGCTWQKRILLADLGENMQNRYITVNDSDTEKYINGQDNIDWSWYSEMRPIPVPEPLTHAEIEKLIGKSFKYVEG